MSTPFPTRFQTVKPALFAGSALFCAAFGTPATAQTPAPKPSPVDTTRYARTFDIFAGQNKTGPYTLSWSGVHATLQDKPLVVVDGNTLPPIAYQLDAAKGTITFLSELKAAQVVRVAYSYNPAVAVRNTNPASAPLSVSLLQMGGTQIQVTALPAGAGKSGAGDTRPLVWSLSKKTALMGGGLTSDVHYSGETGAAWKMGFDRGTDKTGVTANFEQAGREFAEKGGKAFGVSAPAQTWEAGGRLRPANWMGLQIKRREMRDLALTKSGAGTNSDTLGLILGSGLQNSPTLSLVRTSDEALPGTTAAEKTGTTVTTDKIDFAAGLGGAAGNDSAAKLAAKVTKTESDAPDKAADTKADEIAVSLTAQTPDKKGQAVVAVSDATKGTAATTEDKQNLSVKITPAPKLTFSAEQKSVKSGPSDAVIETAQTAIADARAKGDGKAEASAEAAYKKLPGTTETTVQTATAELTPLPNTKLSAGIQTQKTESDVPGSDAVKVAASDLSAQIGTGKAVELTGSITNRSATASGDTKADALATLDTTRARVTLRPFGPALTLTGGYTVNPLDKNNLTLDGERREYGVDAKIGALTLGSGYALTTVSRLDPASASPSDAQYGEVSLTLGLRFSRYTKLSGSYKDALLYGGADDKPLAGLPRATRSYGLGLTHEVGSGLSFTMGGTVARDPSLTGKPADIKGEAKLGVKF